MRIGVLLSVTVVVLLAVAMFTLSGWTRPPIETIQRGYRGLGMVEVYDPRVVAEEVALNQVPEPLPQAADAGPKAGDVYRNVQVLGDVSVGRFARLMTAMTEWVAPEQGCAYCHGEGGDLASDALYTKVVARRMLQMTRHINGDWQDHVGTTGVTCYTCHRGQPVPAETWFGAADEAQGLAGDRAGQNMPAGTVGLTSLPHDPFSLFLDQSQDGIRVVSNTPLPEGNRRSIKQTEATYGLMMHMSQALGVNCTFCHNSRSFISWDQSTPQRGLGWYGLRMVGELNRDYLGPLGDELPHSRLGPLGDAPKANCATCHRGVYKPLFGASMLADYPALAGSATEQETQPSTNQ